MQILNTKSETKQENETMQPPYIQERLKSLNDIETQLCSMLQEASQVTFIFGELKRGNESVKPQFENHVKQFYERLDKSTTQLRKEIQLLDENVGTRLLPINVNKKALGQDTEKMEEQLDLLSAILDPSKSE
ncbi:BAI_1a_G0041090.mRNA.1.CDS.1 [Saccharomyces cerevisiae]|nr:BAI_1a_G0041090.mRNA.1.CDS.1 [Saccharomyces cerevisiae]CAI7270367.1 BAI_1a_G0041090.mRNA.1.CDS.1 [Saccharomyces cerevisiae]